MSGRHRKTVPGLNILKKSHLFYLGIGTGFLLASVFISIFFGEWLRDEVLMPLYVAWLWVVFYVTHLPQLPVWLIVLGLLAIFALRTLQIQWPKFVSDKLDAVKERPPGPVSDWDQTVKFSLKGPLYRKKLYRALIERSQTLETTPQTEVLLQNMNPTKRQGGFNKEEAEEFLQEVHQILDTFPETGGQHAA